MSDLNETDRFETSDDALIRELDDESVILDLKSEQYFGLDDVGTLIWHGLQHGDSIGEILAAVIEEFEVDRETAEADLRAFVGQLAEAGLVTKQ